MRRRMYSAYDRILDRSYGPRDLVDEPGGDDWPEGMARHDNGVHKQSPMARRRLLDSGDVGTSIVTRDEGSPQTYNALQLQGDDRYPDPVTIMASFLPGTTYAPQPGFTMEIRWGVQNFQSEVEVDLTNGCMLSLMASFLRVRVKSDPVVTEGVARIGVTASYGIRPAHAPPTLTRRSSGAVAPAATGEEVQIPDYARGVMPIPLITTANQYAGDFVVRQKDQAGTVLSEHPYIFSGATGYLSASRIALLNDCNLVDIENVDAANNIAMTWLFDLAL